MEERMHMFSELANAASGWGRSGSEPDLIKQLLRGIDIGDCVLLRFSEMVDEIAAVLIKDTYNRRLKNSLASHRREIDEYLANEVQKHGEAPDGIKDFMYRRADRIARGDAAAYVTGDWTLKCFEYLQEPPPKESELRTAWNRWKKRRKKPSKAPTEAPQ